jgi:transcriptional regulator with XRE-family HTH domain
MYTHLSIVFMTINEKIKLIRTTKGITQAKFAKLIGINHDSRVREIESGKYKEVGSAKLEKICNLFPEYALWLMTNKINLKEIKNQQPKRQRQK